jgi:hypothetical protein
MKRLYLDGPTHRSSTSSLIRAPFSFAWASCDIRKQTDWALAEDGHVFGIIPAEPGDVARGPLSAAASPWFHRASKAVTWWDESEGNIPPEHNAVIARKKYPGSD